MLFINYMSMGFCIYLYIKLDLMIVKQSVVLPLTLGVIFLTSNQVRKSVALAVLILL